MEKFRRRFFGRETLPAALVVIPLIALWLWGRWSYARGQGGLGGEGMRVSVLTGWLLAMFLLATVATVLWAAGGPWSDRQQRRDAWSGRGRAFLGYAMLVDSCGILLLCVGLPSGLLGLLDVVRIYLLLAAWTALWAEITWAFRRAGLAPLGAVASLAIAMLLFAGPVTAVPLARAAGGWGTSVQDVVVKTVALGAPLLGVLDAVKNSMTIDWAQLPQMYSLTVFGQDIALGLPTWWVCAAIYAALAAAVWGGSRFMERGKAKAG